MKQSHEIAYFEKVSDLYKALGIPFEQEMQFSIDNLLVLHATIPYKSPIFRTNYYSFIYVKEGKGNYTTDEKTFEYDSNTIYFTNPGHLKAFEFYSLKEAYLITLSEAFLKINVHPRVFEEFPFLLSETVPPQKLDKKSTEEIGQLYSQILKEFKASSSFKNRIIGNLFVVLLLKVKELFWSDYYPIEEGAHQSEIVKTFKVNLEKHYRDLITNNSVTVYQTQDYAKLQNLNPNYFSQVIKSKTGKSSSKWIADKNMGYAKSFLKNSTKSIKEISFALGFLETAHFSNYFKKNTGISPTTYRKNHFKP